MQSSHHQTPSPTHRRRRVASTSPSTSRPDPKRVRVGDDGFLDNMATMSAKAAGKRPEPMDLTSSSPARAFFLPVSASARLAPGSGPQKLVIKNLRSASRNEGNLQSYYKRARDELDTALTAIFHDERPRQPLETLYRGVQDLCRKNEPDKLFVSLRERCERYLNEELLGHMRSEVKGRTDTDLVRCVLQHWNSWSSKAILLRSIYSYLDRTFLLNQKTLPQINDLTISLFRRMVFDSSSSDIGKRLIQGLCQLVELDRRADNAFDPTVLRETIMMFHVFNVYGKSFEPKFLRESVSFFEEFAESRSGASGLRDYIVACNTLLRNEDYRCNAYNFDSTTKRQLLDKAHTILIRNYSIKLLDNGSVAKLLDDHDIASMKALYELLRLADMEKSLKKPWELYVEKTGGAIVNDVVHGDEMIVRLLEFRRTLDIVVRDAFGGAEAFTFALREAFGHFINDRKISSSWRSGTSKVGEMIAKYIDMLLRGGLKTLPKILLSDNKDRAAAERSGQSSTADEDAELDRQLDNGLELFRFIEGKDVFEAFYKKDLARRLLLGRSASQDAERNMLGKLKSECGSTFTHNLEQMFKDQELARDEMTTYNQWMEGSGIEMPKLDLNVSVLSAASWPSYPDIPLQLPQEVLEQTSKFQTYYTSKHSGRRLMWKHALGHCVVKASFDKGSKELLVSSFQAVVLMLFNDVEKEELLSYDQIAHSTRLNGDELSRTLQSLACGKSRVLTKHPKGREVAENDSFSVNNRFVDPKFRVKINQIQLKETKEENEETHERVVADRQLEAQAAIMRIMKSRKQLSHAQLVVEVINHTKSRGAMDPSDIKRNIEKLIEKDYLEREGNMYVYIA